MANLLRRSLGWLTRSYPSPQPMTWESLMGGHRASLAGVSVSESSALNYSPVWAGVSTLSRDIAKLPLILHRRLPNGGKEPFVGHPLYRMLKDRWNPEMTSYKARETMQALCVLYRNAYAEIVRNDAGQPVGLYPITPWRVSPFRDDRTGRLLYRVTNHGGSQTILTPANMIHLSAMSLDGVLGEPLMSHASDSLGLGIAAEQFGGSFFGNGTTFGGVLEVPGALTKETKDVIREQIEAIHAGVERAHKILVLAAGTKFTQRGTAPNEAQYTETRDFQIREVARWLGMPPHKLADLKDAHHTNIEEENIDYYAGPVSGWCEMWEQELGSKLIAPLEYAQQTIKHTMEGVLRGNSSQRAEFYGKLFNVGAISVNRILELENMNPIGPAGEMHLVPLNMVPIERYNEMIDAQIAAKKPAEPEKLPPPPAEDDLPERVRSILAETRTSLEGILAQSQADTLRQVGERVDAGLVSQQQVLEHAERAAVAAQARVDAEARAEVARIAHDEAQQALEVLRAEKTSTDEALTAAQVALEQATAEQAERDTIAMQARAAAEAAADSERLAREAVERSLSEARTKLDTTETELRAALEAKEHAERDVRDFTARVQQAEASAEQRAALVTSAESRADASEHEKAAARADAERAATERDATKQLLQKAEEDRAAATIALAEARTALAASDHKVGDLETFRRDEMERRGRMLLAHRELMVDAVRRVVSVQAERARKKGATPDSLRKWTAAFYDDHQVDVVADMLYPAALAHLTWIGSEEEPKDVARRWAEEYQSQSLRQLTTLADGMVGEEFQAALDTLLTRWVEERPETVARKVINDEISALTQ